MSVNYVAVGYNLTNTPNGAIMYSVDGSTWTSADSTKNIFGNVVYAIAHNGTVWVAGANGTGSASLGYSYDAITWSKSMSASGDILDAVNGVAYDGIGKFVAVGYGTNYSIAYSTDGITWTGCAASKFFGGGTDSYGYCVSYANGYWVAGGYSGTGSSGKLLGYSSDGISWSLANTANLSQLVASITYNGSNWVAVGTPNGIIYTSSSPATWSAATWTVPTGGGFDSLCRSVAVDPCNNSVFAVGQNNTGVSKSTTNGTTWAYNSSTTNLSTTKFVIKYMNGKWFIGQQYSSNTIVVSTDGGNTWANVSGQPFGNNPSSACRGLAYALPSPLPSPPVINTGLTTSSVVSYSSMTVVFTAPTYNGIGAATIVGYKYSLNGGTTYSSTINQTTSPLSIKIPFYLYTDTSYNFVISAVNSNGYSSFASNVLTLNVLAFPCFKSGAKILTNRGYKRIETLKKGDLIKTVLNGYKPVWKLGKRVIHHPASESRIKEQLYVCSSDVYPEVFEDLVITGCHSILVDEWTSEEEKERAIQANGGNVYITDDYYRLPACADLRTHVYEKEGDYTIYHLALENPDYYQNYGIYANGLLVESCSKRYLAELSGMEIL
jgi:hypothetical protein